MRSETDKTAATTTAADVIGQRSPREGANCRLRILRIERVDTRCREGREGEGRDGGREGGEPI